MHVDIQFNPVGATWDELRRATVDAANAGADAVWIFDHLDGSSLRGEGSVFECCTVLGALAATVADVRLGTLVANVANRPAAVLARAMATAQQISGGRVIAGIGAGAAPGSRWAEEHRRAGIELNPDRSARHQAVARQIEVLRAVDGLPVIVGTNTVELAELAGRLADGVNVRLDHPRAAAFLAAARLAADGRRFECSAYCTEAGPAQRELAEALAIDRLIVSGVVPR